MFTGVDMKLEDKLKSIRISYEMSKKELSKYIDVPVKDINAFEKGKKIPDDIILKKIANEFNTTVHFLKGEKHHFTNNIIPADCQQNTKHNINETENMEF